MVNHYNQSPRQWTKQAWIELKDVPNAKDLGYSGTDLGISRKKDDSVMFFDPDPQSNGQAWISMEPETAVIDQVANVR